MQTLFYPGSEWCGLWCAWCNLIFCQNTDLLGDLFVVSREKICQANDLLEWCLIYHLHRLSWKTVSSCKSRQRREQHIYAGMKTNGEATQNWARHRWMGKFINYVIAITQVKVNVFKDVPCFSNSSLIELSCFMVSNIMDIPSNKNQICPFPNDLQVPLPSR